MSPATAPSSLPSGVDRVAVWSDAVRRAGVKLTHQRLEIFRELAFHEGHPDVEAIFRAVRERVPTVSLDTVYRTVWLLHDLGLITTLGPRQDAIRFDPVVELHHHFTCVRCGLVRDLPADAFPAIAIPDAVRAVGGVVEARIEVRGVCARCSEQAAESTSPDTPHDRSDTP